VQYVVESTCERLLFKKSVARFKPWATGSILITPALKFGCFYFFTNNQPQGSCNIPFYPHSVSQLDFKCYP